MWAALKYGGGKPHKIKPLLLLVSPCYKLGREPENPQLCVGNNTITLWAMTKSYRPQQGLWGPAVGI